MAYYLNYADIYVGGADNVVVPATNITVPSGGWVEYQFALEQSPDNQSFFIGSTNNANVIINTDGSISIRADINSLEFDGVSVSSGGLYPFPYDSTIRTLKLTYNIGGRTLNALGNNAAGSRPLRHFLYRVTVFNNLGEILNDYDPSASNGTGSILPDTTVNANNGTLVNFPTDDSQWVFYDAGGGISATITESSQPFSDSVSTTVTGNITATVTETAGVFSSSINATVTPTAVNIDASIIETAAAFSDSLSSVVAGNISATVIETAGLFSDSIGASVAFAKFAQVSEVNSAFSDSIITSLAIQVDGSIIETNAAFSDVLRVTTPSKWADISPSANNWISSSVTSNNWTTSTTTTNSWLKIT